MLNNKLNNNISNIREKNITREYEHHTYVTGALRYNDYVDDEDESDELMKKKRAWAELEKE